MINGSEFSPSYRDTYATNGFAWSTVPTTPGLGCMKEAFSWAVWSPSSSLVLPACSALRPKQDARWRVEWRRRWYWLPGNASVWSGSRRPSSLHGSPAKVTEGKRKGGFQHSVFWAVNVARVWSRHGFNLLTFSVQDVFQVLTRSAALQSCQVMKLWNGTPVFLLKCKTFSQIFPHWKTIESNYFYLYLYMQYFFLSMWFYLCHVVNVLRWVQMPRASIWCKFIPASITDIKHITSALDKQMCLYVHVTTTSHKFKHVTWI